MAETMAETTEKLWRLCSYKCAADCEHCVTQSSKECSDNIPS